MTLFQFIMLCFAAFHVYLAHRAFAYADFWQNQPYDEAFIGGSTKGHRNGCIILALANAVMVVVYVKFAFPT